MIELVYFEINNWFSGQDYPCEEPFVSWVENDQLGNKEWAKENKLIVMKGVIDMSVSWCVIAPKEWVERECPALLSDRSYTYDLCYYGGGGERRETKEGKFSDFLCKPDKDGNMRSRICQWKFPEYCSENFGVTWVEEEEDYSEDE